MFKSRKTIIGALLLLAFVVTSATFAIWSSVDLEDESVGETVTIGEGRQATVTATLDTQGTGTLVPTGEIADSVSSSPVESIEYTFLIDWTDNANDGENSTVAILVDNVSNATAAGLLNFDIDPVSGSSITEGTQLTVTITVTLDEPASQSDYDAIINELVTFDVTFTVTDPA